MGKKIKGNWELPHANNHFTDKDGAKVAEKIYSSNQARMEQVAAEAGTTVEKLKKVIAGEYNRRRKIAEFDEKPMDTIRDLLQSRVMTTEEEMAISNLRQMMTNDSTWRQFLKSAGITAKEYDESKWSYNKQTKSFEYDGFISVSWGGGYYMDQMEIGYVTDDDSDDYDF